MGQRIDPFEVTMDPIVSRTPRTHHLCPDCLFTYSSEFFVVESFPV